MRENKNSIAFALWTNCCGTHILGLESKYDYSWVGTIPQGSLINAQGKCNLTLKNVYIIVHIYESSGIIKIELVN